MVAKFLLIFLIATNDVYGYKLQQVLLLSRHNIRAPLTENLERMTPRKWPKWDEFGHLTQKGALLEGYMGEYFFSWLKQEGLFSNECPKDETIRIYANAPHRTQETAKAFAKSAFKGCNVAIHYKNNTRMDPVFNPVIHNKTEAFKKAVLKDVQSRLDDLKLRDAYLELNRILDLNNSEICREDSYCDLTEIDNDIIYEIGEETNIKGSLTLGNSIVDAFLMSYYDGLPLDTIAWGELESDQWATITRITKENQNVRFNSSNIAKDAAKPLLDYMFDIFIRGKPEFTLLVGHDSNLNSVMAALGFKGYNLPGQYEKTPIGGKLVFQKWHDKELNRDLLKVNYIYQSMDQLRNGARISLENPPQSVVMEIQNCIVDSAGFCLWKDFLKVIKSLL